jgi:hypothetical protein
VQMNPTTEGIWGSGIGYWKCPNCGGADFTEIVPGRYRCAYCGSILGVREVKPPAVDCPHCRFKNERGDRYCHNCGKPLTSWALEQGGVRDPAVVSILVTVVGSLFLSVIGPIVGFFLGYKALAQARSIGDVRGEKLARTAVTIAWAFIAFNGLSLCLSVGVFGLQAVSALIAEILQNLSNWIRGLG